MKKFIYVLFMTFLFVLSAQGQGSVSGWGVTGYQVSDGKWTVEVTQGSVTVRDSVGKCVKVRSAHVRMESVDKTILEIYHKVDLSRPEDDKRVKAVCNFFLRRDGTIRIRFEGQEILFPTRRRIERQIGG